MKCFLSTSVCRNKGIEESINFCGNLSDKNVELSAPHPKESLDQIERTLINFKKKGFNFVLHNYFPPPKKSFVLNIASDEKKVQKNCSELILNALSLSEKIGASVYGIHAGYLSKAIEGKDGTFIFDKNQNYLETLKRSSQFINSINKYFEKNKIKLLIENLFPGVKVNSSLFCTFEQIKELMDLIPDNVGLLLDLGHLNISSNFFKFSKQSFLDKYISNYKDRLLEIHISENNGIKDEHLTLKQDSWQYSFIREIFNETKSNNKKPVFCLEARNGSVKEIRNNLENINKIIA